MIVVSDTSPLNYLLLIDAIDLLPRMYGSVVIPKAVERELLSLSAPLRVRQWAAHLPDWISVRSPAVVLRLLLDAGEQEAISLALESQAELILIDERKGRSVAKAYGLRATGVLGVLEEASHRGLVDLKSSLTALQQSGFYVSAQLIKSLLDSHASGEYI